MILALKALGEGLKTFFELRNQRSNVWGFDFNRVLKCSLTGLSTLPTLPFYWQGFFSSGLWLMGRLRETRLTDTQGCPCSAFTTQPAIFILQWLVHCSSSHYILFLMEPKQTDLFLIWARYAWAALRPLSRAKARLSEWLLFIFG